MASSADLQEAALLGRVLPSAGISRTLHEPRGSLSVQSLQLHAAATANAAGTNAGAAARQGLQEGSVPSSAWLPAFDAHGEELDEFQLPTSCACLAMGGMGFTHNSWCVLQSCARPDCSASAQATAERQVGGYPGGSPGTSRQAETLETRAARRVARTASKPFVETQRLGPIDASAGHVRPAVVSHKSMVEDKSSTGILGPWERRELRRLRRASTGSGDLSPDLLRASHGPGSSSVQAHPGLGLTLRQKSLPVASSSESPLSLCPPQESGYVSARPTRRGSCHKPDKLGSPLNPDKSALAADGPDGEPSLSERSHLTENSRPNEPPSSTTKSVSPLPGSAEDEPAYPHLKGAIDPIPMAVIGETAAPFCSRPAEHVPLALEKPSLPALDVHPRPSYGDILISEKSCVVRSSSEVEIAEPNLSTSNQGGAQGALKLEGGIRGSGGSAQSSLPTSRDHPVAEGGTHADPFMSLSPLACSRHNSSPLVGAQHERYTTQGSSGGRSPGALVRPLRSALRGDDSPLGAKGDFIGSPKRVQFSETVEIRRFAHMKLTPGRVVSPSWVARKLEQPDIDSPVGSAIGHVQLSHLM